MGETWQSALPFAWSPFMSLPAEKHLSHFAVGQLRKEWSQRLGLGELLPGTTESVIVSTSVLELRSGCSRGSTATSLSVGVSLGATPS